MALYVSGLALIINFGMTRPTSPLSLLVLAWMLVAHNFLFGPIAYDPSLSWLPTLLYLALCFAFFLIPYLVALRTKVVLRGRRDLFHRARTPLLACALFGAGLLLAGGLKTALPYLLSLNLGGLRGAFIEDVNVLSKLGWLFLWPAFFFIVSFALPGRYAPGFWLAAIFLSLFAIPLFSAGRQIYLQVILLILISFSLVRRHQAQMPDEARAILKRRRRTVSILILVCIGFIAAVSQLRFGGVSQEYFGNKLNVYATFSGASLSEGYEALWAGLSPTLQDIWVEFAYYFGAQLPRFGEVYHLQTFPIVEFDPMSKVAILERNFDKLLSGDTVTALSASDGVVGSIASFTWKTALPKNMELFGEVGNLLICALFGWVAGIAYNAYRSFPLTFEALNLCVANGVVAFYSIMFSPFGETNFFLYYLASLVLFALRFRV
ncbi:hypothetical protein [Rubellimicrobium roseum]|uniref:Uncharacterized protein n=1 Tax=Rubellimicrobium roseum TaxID=687525 RepID=A0A5C4NEF1_9RHOB|nr:hypothetical protein [Rubellimicrobium roseum]TNC71476.1 hypothetical protein FHG71_11025 [Rubellimicrobium roseum]